MNLPPRFRKQVRRLQALRGAAIGLFVGGVACAVALWLDQATRLTIPDWLTHPAALVAICGLSVVVGVAVATLQRLSDQDLARSIDHRAETKDRVTSSMAQQEGSFQTELQSDVEAKLADLKESQVFPLKVRPVHSLAIMGVALPILFSYSSIILNTLNPARAAQEKKLQEASVNVESLAKLQEKLAEESKDDVATKQREAAKEMRKLAKDLKANKLTQSEAIKSADELKKQLKSITKEQAKKVEASFAKAEEAAKRMEERDTTPREGESQTAEQAAENEQKKQEIKEKQAKIDDLKKQLEDLKKKMESGKMDPIAGAEAAKMSEALRKQIEELQKEIEKIKISQETKDLFEKLASDPEMQKLRELAAEMAKEMKATQKKAEMEALTEEELQQLREKIAQLEKQLEEFTEAMKDPEKYQEFLDALREMIKNMKEMEGQCKVCVGIGPGLSLGIPGFGGGIDFQMMDTGKVNKSDKPVESKGKTTPEVATGQRQESGEEQSQDVRAPADLDRGSVVPRSKVSLAAKRKAEEAIKRKSIPEKHVRRVRQYFENNP